MNEAVKEKFESAEEGSIISDVAEMKELCEESDTSLISEEPTAEELLNAKILIAEQHFADYDKLYHEVAKQILDARREALAELVDLVGVGHTFQDTDGIVHHVAYRNGTFVEFTPYEVKRTQRVYAESGSHIFARKTAEALGFENIFKPMKTEDAKALADLTAGIVAGAKEA